MSAGATTLRGLIRRRTTKLLSPRPRLTVSEWAAAHRVLSPESSAEAGRWSSTRSPALNAIMDSFGDPAVEVVAVQAASQVGKSEALLNLLGYIIDQAPGPALLVMPTLELGRAWSLERFAPMVRDCAVLRHRVADPKTRDSATTILSRRFPGGSLTIVGANAAAALSSRPIRYCLLDEVDRYPIVLAAEGSPVELAMKRTAAWPNRKLVMISSPTTTQLSVIAQWHDQGDQRVYQVACPDCGTRGPLSLERIQWVTDADGQHHPDSASWLCPACGVLTPETQKAALLASGAWTATHPGRAIHSYHLPALASPFVPWAKVVEEFLAAKAGGPSRLQVFTNTVEGLPWAEVASGPQVDHRLAHRLERYAAEVPAGVAVLTAGVDTQGNRLAVSVWGWGRDEEGWLVHHAELMGSPAESLVWAELDQLLARQWQHDSGALLTIRAAAIDTGGSHTSDVYRYVAPRQGRAVARLLALKGHSARTYPHLLSKPATANRHGVRLFSYGSAVCKDHLAGRLAVEQPGPGYLHFGDFVDAEYLQQLTAERVVYRKQQGRNVRLWEKWRARSEAMDCAIYGYLALLSLGRPVLDRLGELVPAAPGTAAAPAPAPTPPPVRLRYPWEGRTTPRRLPWAGGGPLNNPWLRNW